MDYYYENELYHHGIKGMKWGVRRFQKKDGSLTNAGKKRYDESDNKQNMTKDEQDAAKKARMKKYVKVGAAVAGTALAAYGAYKIYDLYTGRKQETDPATGFRLLNKNMSTEEHLNKINPGRIKLFNRSIKNKEIIQGSSQNCMLCTTTYELRKRGFDVHAGYSNTGYTSDGLFTKIYKNYNGTVKIPHSGKLYSDDKGSQFFNDITDSILKQGGSGSRGNIMVYWKNGMGGHSMIWENEGGRVKFMDGQTGQEYKNFARDVLSHVSMDRPTEILRTDNLDFNIPELKKVINSDTILKTYVDHGAEVAFNLAFDDSVQLATTAGAAAALYGYSVYDEKNKRKNQNGGGKNAR